MRSNQKKHQTTGIIIPESPFKGLFSAIGMFMILSIIGIGLGFAIEESGLFRSHADQLIREFDERITEDSEIVSIAQRELEKEGLPDTYRQYVSDTAVRAILEELQFNDLQRAGEQVDLAKSFDERSDDLDLMIQIADLALVNADSAAQFKEQLGDKTEELTVAESANEEYASHNDDTELLLTYAEEIIVALTPSEPDDDPDLILARSHLENMQRLISDWEPDDPRRDILALAEYSINATEQAQNLADQLANLPEQEPVEGACLGNRPYARYEVTAFGTHQEFNTFTCNEGIAYMRWIGRSYANFSDADEGEFDYKVTSTSWLSGNILASGEIDFTAGASTINVEYYPTE
jgi:hypothetical protein